MALDIPSEPKVYTSVYDNFKGVDFTNDPSNVYRRRSPSGKNMLPDLDGRPYKRHGWKIDVSAKEFLELALPELANIVTAVTATIVTLQADIDAIQAKIDAGTATTDDLKQKVTDEAEKAVQEQRLANFTALANTTKVVPYRTYYFELGGIDYILVYNNLGVFLYDGDNLEYFSSYYLPQGNLPSESFPVSADTMKSDSKRGFFYEANGVAGFYLFNGGKMFRLSVEKVLVGINEWEDQLILREIKPYYPRTFIACDPSSGAGTEYEPVNILTRRRSRSYTRNSSNTVYKYRILEGIQNDNFTVNPDRMPVVKVIIGSTWTELKHLSERASVSDKYFLIHTDDYNYIVLKNADGTNFAPKDGVDGEDNVIIEYTARNDLQESVKILKETTCTLARNNDGSWGYGGGHEISLFSAPLEIGTVKYGQVSVVVNTSGVSDVSKINVYVKTSSNLWSLITNYGSIDSLFDITVDPYGNNVTYQSKNSAFWNVPYKSDTTYTQEGKSGHRRVYELKFQYNPEIIEYNQTQLAFFDCTKFSVYGTGLVNQVFACGTQQNGYKSRLWYSKVGQPEYFPETSYTEVGSNDTAIMGTLKCGEYLGVIKQGKTTDTSVYLAYPTSFDNDTTFAVKQSIGGIGAVSNGAFNVLNEEPLFLSADGVMGIEVGSEEHRLRSRSYFVDGMLTKEQSIETAISFVHDGMYWLGVGTDCFVLDGNQKSSWVNEKTNLQYECYYLDNIPAQCFAKIDNELYWTDYYGALCKFKKDTEPYPYMDDYITSTYTPKATNPTNFPNVTFDISGDELNAVAEDDYIIYRGEIFRVDTVSADQGLADGVLVNSTDNVHTVWTTFEPAYYYGGSSSPELNVGDVVKYTSKTLYGMSDIAFEVVWKQTLEGVHYYRFAMGRAFDAVWSTLADDDGMVHYFKNMKKKGCLVSLLPESDTGVEVWLKADEKEPVKIGETDVKGQTLPFEFYIKKKVKKYKRLQIICKNSGANDGFGIDQIIKSYTVGNYSKKRG